MRSALTVALFRKALFLGTALRKDSKGEHETHANHVIPSLWILCAKLDPAKELFNKVKRSVLISCPNQSIWFCKGIGDFIRVLTKLTSTSSSVKSSLSTSPCRMLCQCQNRWHNLQDYGTFQKKNIYLFIHLFIHLLICWL